jgi:uncharacterized protein YcgL (UPF0745 family)
MKLDLYSEGYVERWLQEICVLYYDAKSSSTYIYLEDREYKMG